MQHLFKKEEFTDDIYDYYCQVQEGSAADKDEAESDDKPEDVKIEDSHAEQTQEHTPTGATTNLISEKSEKVRKRIEKLNDKGWQEEKRNRRLRKRDRHSKVAKKE